MGGAARTWYERRRLSFGEEERAVMSPRAVSLLDEVLRLEGEVGRARQRVVEAQEAVRAAEKADIDSAVKAVEEGRKDTPKLKAPAAREKAEEAQRHAVAVAIVLSRKHDELGELLESERSQMVAAARSLSDEGLLKIRRAADAFAKAVDSNMAKVNLPLWLESGGDILNGAQRTPDHSLMVAVRAVQDAVTDLEEGERERRQNVDRPKPEGEEVRRPAVNTSWWSPDDDI